MECLSGMMPVIFYFWKNSRWPPGVKKIGKNSPFSPILAHFMLYLRQNSLNRPEIDVKGGEQVKVTIPIVCRVIRFKMVDWRPFWIAKNEGWHQTAPTDLSGCAWELPCDCFIWKQTSSATRRCFRIFNISRFLTKIMDIFCRIFFQNPKFWHVLLHNLAAVC